MAEIKLLSSCETDYNSDLHSWVDIERQIRNLAECGFTHTQWMQNWQGEYMYSPSEMFQARDILRDYNIKAHSIHASEGGVRTKTVNGKVDSSAVYGEHKIIVENAPKYITTSYHWASTV